MGLVPRATYRLQLTRDFNFAAVRRILPYLSALGVSHLYLSPIFRALPGSQSGYDVIDHSTINPELGSPEEFRSLAEEARAHGLGIVLDIVPNHMAVASAANLWWRDVLENGPSSEFAAYFDIDWQPLRESMRNRLLVPVLEQHFGEELNRGRLRLRFDCEQGAFDVQYFELYFPLDPQTYPRIFRNAPEPQAGEEDRAELQSLLDQFAHLPAHVDLATEPRERRRRDKEVFKRRLAALCGRSAGIRCHVQTAVARFNCTGNADVESLDALAELLSAQPYRLAYWKVAGDEINYRRFFDVNQLAALRADNPDVFIATHRLAIALAREQLIDGLRIDHVDGLHDPLAYLQALNATLGDDIPRPYIVVEKILATHERLREWPVHGTTGYEFGALAVAWLTAESGIASLMTTYRQFLQGNARDYGALLYDCKKLLMRTSLAAEVAVLGQQLDRIAQAHRDTADFTQMALRDALIEIIAAFPVYRTYVSDAGANDDDVRAIRWAVGAARKRARGAERSIFQFIEDVLLCSENVADAKRRQAVLDFARKFQQVTSPVMAKSVEDTAFYSYVPLLSANEVGGDPAAMHCSTAALHRANAERGARWPHSMLATSTHDSKRGEDLRYRLCVLAEMPKAWRQFLQRAARLLRGCHTEVEGESAPGRNDEYLLLQILIGAWPRDDEITATSQRLKDYALKAIREAKDRTSWIDPDAAYEAATLAFLDACFSKPRLRRLRALALEIAAPLQFFGALNALSATVLKLTVPGVPDVYQGAESMNLALVDPDNRRPVDFAVRASACERFMSSAGDTATMLQAALERWREGELKFFVTWRLLQFRREHVELFTHGDYTPLDVQGERADFVCAFSRRCGSDLLVVIVTRWLATLMKGKPQPTLGTSEIDSLWSDTRVTLPTNAAQWRDVLSDRIVDSIATDTVRLADLLLQIPVAVLHGRN